MAREARVSIILTAKNLTKAAFGEVDSAVGKLKKVFSGMNAQLAGLGLALSATGLVKWLVDVNSEYGRLITQLETFDGLSNARGVFKDLSDFAARTPFQIDEVVKAYISLRTAGIQPTLETMQRIGDQSSAMGGRIQDFANAIARATTGEFDPLKTFGVQMHVQGDKAIASFKGVTTVIGRDAASITHYLEGISKANFAGGMERESKTVGGALSNLKDSTESLGRAIGDAGLTKDITAAAEAMTGFLGKATAIEEISVAYIRFKGVLYAIYGALKLTAHLFVSPIIAAGLALASIVHLVEGFIGGALIPVAAMFDAVTANKFNASGALSSFVGSQFKAFGADLAGVGGVFKGVYDDFKDTIGETNKLGDELEEAKKRLADSRARAAGATNAPASGLTKTGLATAPGNSMAPGDPAKAEKKAMDAAIDAIRDRIGIEKELFQLNENRGLALSRMAAAEDDARQMLARGNLTLQQRLDLLRAVANSKDVRDGVGLLNSAESAKLLDPIKGTLKPQITQPGAGVLPKPKVAAGATVDEAGFGVRIGSALRDAFSDGERLDNLIANMASHTMLDFGNAIESAFAAFAEGSVSAGKAFEGAMLGAIATVASSFGQFLIGKAIAATGDGLLGDPRGFAAAGEYFAGATVMFAVAGALRGAASRATGGGRGSASAKTSTLSGSADKGEATLVIEGGVLNMDDPRQADALANALSTLSDRRVTIKGRRAG